MPGATHALARFVSRSAFAAVPPPVVETARSAILDVLGVAIAARDEPLLVPLLAVTSHVRDGARIIGRAERTAPLTAALVNGALCHALDFDDTHQPVPIHPSSSLVPALLAASHGRRVSGADFLTAYAVGAESAIRIGLAAGRSHMDRGWHGTGTFGTFGAAAGAARLFGLTAEAIETALGIAAVQAAGLLNAAAGTMCKPLHAGKAAMNGYLAAELAGGGFTAPDAVLDRPYGYLTAFSDAPDHEAVTIGLGDEWRLTELSFKLYACCALTHAVIDAARALRAAGLAVDAVAPNIDAIVVEASRPGIEVAGIPRPSRGLEGKFSLAYTVVAALLGRRMTPEAFTDAAVTSADVVALLPRVVVECVKEYRDGEGAVTVRLRDGTARREYVPIARGNPGAPWSREDLEGKFLALASPVLGVARASRVRDLVLLLEELPDVSALVELLAV